MVDVTPSSLVPERPLLVLVFVGLALVVTAGFVPTFEAYVATDSVTETEPRITEAAMGPDGDVLEVSLRVTNPTRSEITIISGQITAWDDDTLLTTIAGANIPRTTVPAGETVSVPITLDVDPDTRYQAATAASEGNLRFKGYLRVTVGDEHVKVRFRPHQVVDDDG